MEGEGRMIKFFFFFILAKLRKRETTEMQTNPIETQIPDQKSLHSVRLELPSNYIKAPIQQKRRSFWLAFSILESLKT
jgi:hypothetical protein